MNTVNIINYRYLADNLKERTVGGIQTYIYNLCRVIKRMGYQAVIYQIGNDDFSVEYDNCTVKGFKCAPNKLSTLALKSIPTDELVIFATEELTHKWQGPSIAIQHGIYWDRPNYSMKNSFLNNFYVFRRANQAYKKICQMEQADAVVCVDYNFINWYRSQVAYPRINTVAIPNFTDIPPKIEKPDDKINIIFARRFVEFRGTRVFALAIKPLLEKFNNINVTIAGEGPDEQWLKDELGSCECVNFTKYSSSEAIQMHSDKHIAVIPTTGSEGTSLSLLEAMASHCAVVCTDVGGMTNIVVDDYNGKIIKAGCIEQLTSILEKLIESSEMRNRLADKAYETVKRSFSIKQWENKWESLIMEYIGK